MTDERSLAAVVEQALKRIEDRLLERLQGAALDLVPLEAFAAAVGLAAKTVANDLTSKQPLRARRWPPFRKVGGQWVSTRREIDEWLERQPSSWGSPEVLRMIERRPR